MNNKYAFMEREFMRIADLAISYYGEDIIGDGWRLTIDRSKRRLGCCSYRNKTISISKYLLELSSDEQITDTIAHEIAHALCPGAKHNATWSRVAKSLGADGKQYADECSMPVPHKYELVHADTGEVFNTYHSKPRRDPSVLFIKNRKRETIGKLVYRKVR